MFVETRALPTVGDIGGEASTSRNAHRTACLVQVALLDCIPSISMTRRVSAMIPTSAIRAVGFAVSSTATYWVQMVFRPGIVGPSLAVVSGHPGMHVGQLVRITRSAEAVSTVSYLERVGALSRDHVLGTRCWNRFAVARIATNFDRRATIIVTDASHNIEVYRGNT